MEEVKTKKGGRSSLMYSFTQPATARGSSCCQGKALSAQQKGTSFLRVLLACRSDAGAGAASASAGLACTTLARQNRRWWGGVAMRQGHDPPVAKGPALEPRGAASSSEAEA